MFLHLSPEVNLLLLFDVTNFQRKFNYIQYHISIQWDSYLHITFNPFRFTISIFSTLFCQKMYHCCKTCDCFPEIVLKIRISGSSDPDFIEVELPKWKLTYNNLLKLCCEELQCSEDQVERIRKLPNTKLRSDRDIGRLENFQEIEIIIKGPPGSDKPTNCYQSISTCKDQTILYWATLFGQYLIFFMEKVEMFQLFAKNFPIDQIKTLGGQYDFYPTKYICCDNFISQLLRFFKWNEGIEKLQKNLYNVFS